MATTLLTTNLALDDVIEEATPAERRWRKRQANRRERQATRQLCRTLHHGDPDDLGYYEDDVIEFSAGVSVSLFDGNLTIGWGRVS